jgi:competence protein ComEA
VSTHVLAEWVAKHRTAVAVFVLGTVAVCIAAVVLPRPPAPSLVVQQPTLRTVAVAPAPPTPAPPSLIVVHLSGEVISPGVYQLPVGARIDDAVRAAGGVTPVGDVHRLNLAARLADGQHVVVPRKAELSLASPVESASAVGSPVAIRVNINTATVAELDGLPGVGPVTAQRIVAYRQQNGPFTSIEQLRDAKLVNQPTFEKIRDRVEI